MEEDDKKPMSSNPNLISEKELTEGVCPNNNGGKHTPKQDSGIFDGDDGASEKVKFRCPLCGKFANVKIHAG